MSRIGRYAPQQPRPRIILLWRRRSSGSSPRVRRHWHDTRREDYEQRSQSVRAVRGRSPRSRGVRAVGLVGGAQLDLCHVRLASPQPSRRAPGTSPGLSYSLCRRLPQLGHRSPLRDLIPARNPPWSNVPARHDPAGSHDRPRRKLASRRQSTRGRHGSTARHTTTPQ